MVNDSADVTSSGKSFHVCGPAIGKSGYQQSTVIYAGCVATWSREGLDRLRLSNYMLQSWVRLSILYRNYCAGSSWVLEWATYGRLTQTRIHHLN